MHPSAPSPGRVSFVDRLLPPELLGGDPETLRLARLCVYFAGALSFQALFFTGLYSLLGLPGVARLVLPATVLMVLTPAVLRRTKSIRAASVHLCIVTLGVLDSVGYYTGGLYAPATWWTVVVPVLGLMMGGKRVALGAFGLVVAQAAAACAWTLAGRPWPALLDAPKTAALGGIAIAMLAVLVLSLAWLYELAKERMRTALLANNEEMCLVLDNVGQGFLSADVGGALVGRSSAAVRQWFGAPREGVKLWDYLGAGRPEFASWLDTCWQSLGDGILPLELAVCQLPERLSAGGRHYRIEYRPLARGGALYRMVVVITDVTNVVETERAEMAQREFAVALDHAIRDRAAVLQFLEETEDQLVRLAHEPSNARRLVHTIKGNCGLFGVRSVAECCHAIETEREEDGGPITEAHVGRLRAAWAPFASRVGNVLNASAQTIEVGRDDYERLLEAVRGLEGQEGLGRLVAGLECEPGRRALLRVAEQARALARRLEKGEVCVTVDASDVRLDRERWRGFWSAFVHALRNAIDHGLEFPEERAAEGKPAEGHLRLGLREREGAVVVEIEDDGRGIDWGRVARRAAERGLPCATPAELEAALLSDGFSTRDEVSETSGRGVGLSALATAVRELGGELRIETTLGRGTTLRVSVPSTSASAACAELRGRAA